MFRVPIAAWVSVAVIASGCAGLQNTSAQDAAWARWKKCDRFPTVRLKDIKPNGDVWVWTSYGQDLAAWRECDRAVRLDQQRAGLVTGSESAVINTATISTPLPPDVRVVSSAITHKTDGYSGHWVGLWLGSSGNGSLEHTLVVDDAQTAGEIKKVRVVYSWGAQPTWGISKGGYSRHEATIGTDGRLRLSKFTNGADVVYWLSPDGVTLFGEYSRAGTVTVGRFQRPAPPESR
jgi:hypothetical protein